MNNDNVLMVVSSYGLDVDFASLARDIQSVSDMADGKFYVMETYNEHYNEEALIFTRNPLRGEEAADIYYEWLVEQYPEEEEEEE